MQNNVRKNSAGSDSGSASGDGLLRTEEAAQLLGFSPRALEAWRCRGGGPRYLRVGRSIRYRRSDLHAWAEARVYSSTAEYDREAVS
jgi:excisionase family DNA binding protein